VVAFAEKLAVRRRSVRGTFLLAGTVMTYLSVLVLIPLAALVATSSHAGWDGMWQSVSNREAVAALELTLWISLAVALVDAVMGTLIAWVLVRDDFRGKEVVNALIDLPFALPTIVAGLTLLALYGPRGGSHVHLTQTRWAIAIALAFVTLPFVVRTVQPVLHELDRDMEEAAASLGAQWPTIIRRIILPNLAPAVLSGVALAFARAVGEFGSVVLIAGNIPFKTETAAVYIFGRATDYPAGAASVSLVLLLISLAVLLCVGALRRLVTRHDR
jgi:sulfate transport system permease protein